MIQRSELSPRRIHAGCVLLACAVFMSAMSACIGGVFRVCTPGGPNGPLPTPSQAEPVRPETEKPYSFALLVTGPSADLVRADGLGLDRNAVIFYEHQFGRYPRIFQGRTEHGGIPQLGNLNEHLRKVRRDIEREIPDADWEGLAIIDYESRPVLWREMRWDYKRLSRGIVRQNNPEFTDEQVEAEAKRQYEEANRRWYIATIELAKALRPNARWGYFAVPTTRDKDELDELSWLVEHSDVLYSAVYAREYGVLRTPANKDESEAHKLMDRVGRATRFHGELAEKAENKPAIFMITRVAYDDVNATYKNAPLNPEDARSLVVGPYLSGMEGTIFWDYVPTPQRAAEITRALEPLAPLIAEVRQRDAQERARRQQEQAQEQDQEPAEAPRTGGP